MTDREVEHAVFATAAGWVGALRSPRGLQRLTLPRKTAEEAREALGDCPERLTETPDGLAELVNRLQRYFQGQRVAFPDPLDLSPATAFQRQVWAIARTIPYGETRSYQWLARQMGRPKAARAVGQALGRNPLPVLIPCHRVLTSSGGLGGFSGGLEMKRYLLDLEAQGIPAEKRDRSQFAFI